MASIGSTSVMIVASIVAGAAAAQTIELSSDSLGTVRVNPGTIATPAPAARAGTGAHTGVDLGIRRKADGTLYDALDPNQNPAAATTTTSATPGAAAGATTPSGTGAASGATNRTLTPAPASGPGSAGARSIGGELGAGAGGELGAGSGGALGTGGAAKGASGTTGASTSAVGTGPAARANGLPSTGNAAATTGSSAGGSAMGAGAASGGR